MNITVVLGTARVGRVSEHVAKTIERLLTEAGGSVTYVDVKDHVQKAVTVPPWGEGGADEHPTKWKEIVSTTDAFVFVLPEYNHSYPGEWKLLMDTLFAEYADKRAYIVAVGGGVFAGARVMEHVLPLLVNYKFVLSAKRLHVGSASAQFDETGALVDEETAKRFAAFAADVVAGA